MNQTDALTIGIPRELGHHRGWFLFLGLGLIALGVIAIAQSFAATFASIYFLGGVMLAAALIEAVDAIMVGRWSGLFLHLFGAVLFGVTGLLLMRYPIATAEGLTAVLGMYFVVSGVFRIIAPLFLHLPNSGLHALNGIVSLVLGTVILAQWPVSGLWVIGTFIGVDLILRGLAWSASAIALPHDVPHEAVS
jgi:uncharacterized membrane protein HdeD (DUF308 family)